MKRGLITWDQEALPRSALASRLEQARRAAQEAGVPAALVYTDVWRSNDVRRLTNFMPYWNRSLLAVPNEGEPLLLCGLSPRVYPWIRSVSLLEEIRPAKNLARRLLELAAERGWKRIGAVDLEELPHDAHRELQGSALELVPLDASFLRTADESELALHRKAAALTRRLLEDALTVGKGATDRHLVATLERAFRRAGFEDLVVWVTDGRTEPRHASGRKLGESFSAVVAAEYLGHWVQVARTAGPEDLLSRLSERLESLLRDLTASAASFTINDLSSSHPFRAAGLEAVRAPGSLVAVHVEDSRASRYLHGDTCRVTAPGVATLL